MGAEALAAGWRACSCRTDGGWLARDAAPRLPEGGAAFALCCGCCWEPAMFPACERMTDRVGSRLKRPPPVDFQKVHIHTPHVLNMIHLFLEVGRWR